ncbi:MAG: hypothetical protein KZQ96_05060 [Candidatus Thiodiazotropha sp. (ex Lucinoma borealis)]|nr:hypothetical protein [Candidatus Thiodiazotropha sp. (ex Lucinoma borealis)]MCU7868401.1 hypothetical protein [Candidatus Thiodiazotropha sp. (ex Lucinoma borealis)]
MSDQLFSSVIMATAKNLVCPSLNFSNYITLPIPVVSNSKLFIGFLVGRGEVIDPEFGYQIWPPSLLALFDTDNGQFYELRPISPNLFSINDSADTPLGKGYSPPEKSTTEYLQNELHVFQCCDNVIAAIHSQQDHQSELKRYDEYFRSLTEDTLVPYYKKLCLAKLN